MTSVAVAGTGIADLREPAAAAGVHGDAVHV